MTSTTAPTHEFEFVFTNREQFYAVVNTLNKECGKGKWTIKGRVLKSLKRAEQYTWMSSTTAIRKVVVVPQEKADIEAFLRFVHSPELK